MEEARLLEGADWPAHDADGMLRTVARRKGAGWLATLLSLDIAPYQVQPGVPTP